MKSAVILLTLVAISQAGVARSRGFDGRIVNGENNYLARSPTRLPANEIQVIAGSVNLNDPKSIHRVVEVIVHKQYSSIDSWRNDIALIKVNVPFVVSATLNYASLPESGQEVPVDATAVVSGWGRLWQGGPTPPKLQHAEIRIVAQVYCSNVYANMGLTIHNTHACAHDPVKVTGSCHGDSGGPLTVEGKLVGLVSWANGCANVRYPTVYTRVPEYVDWINANAV